MNNKCKTAFDSYWFSTRLQDDRNNLRITILQKSSFKNLWQTAPTLAERLYHIYSWCSYSFFMAILKKIPHFYRYWHIVASSNSHIGASIVWIPRGFQEYFLHFFLSDMMCGYDDLVRSGLHIVTRARTLRQCTCHNHWCWNVPAGAIRNKPLDSRSRSSFVA